MNDLDVLERELERVVDRVRHLALGRLAQPAPPWASRELAARETAQLLADAAAELEGAPPRRLPQLHASALGDQLAVTGRDVLLAARSGAADHPGGPAAVVRVIDAVLKLRHAV